MAIALPVQRYRLLQSIYVLGRSGLNDVRRAARCLCRAIGVTIAIALLETLARLTGEPLVRVPFVTSIVLILGEPDSKAAKPYGVIVGHLLSALAGFTRTGDNHIRARERVTAQE